MRNNLCSSFFFQQSREAFQIFICRRALFSERTFIKCHVPSPRRKASCCTSGRRQPAALYEEGCLSHLRRRLLVAQPLYSLYKEGSWPLSTEKAACSALRRRLLAPLYGEGCLLTQIQEAGHLQGINNREVIIFAYRSRPPMARK